MQNNAYTASQMWDYARAALSAQPSPGGQDALDCIGRIEEAIEFRVPHDIYAAVHGELAELKAALAARQPVGAAVEDSLTVGGGQAWVVADGQGTRWRMWGSFGPEWTSERNQALHFARRADAEAFANDDEDAWLIQAVPND